LGPQLPQRTHERQSLILQNDHCPGEENFIRLRASPARRNPPASRRFSQARLRHPHRVVLREVSSPGEVARPSACACRLTRLYARPCNGTRPCDGTTCHPEPGRLVLANGVRDLLLGFIPCCQCGLRIQASLVALSRARIHKLFPGLGNKLPIALSARNVSFSTPYGVAPPAWNS